MKNLLRLLIVPALALGLGFTTPVAMHGASSPTRIQPGMHVSDSQIESTIRTKLAKSKIGKDGFRFKVARGTVTWEGTTRVGQHKGAATRMARTSGATQVVNNIQVTGTGSSHSDTPMKKALIQ